LFCNSLKPRACKYSPAIFCENEIIDFNFLPHFLLYRLLAIGGGANSNREIEILLVALLLTAFLLY
jgi:hypothetical protein